MTIQTNLESLIPRKDRLKQSIRPLSGMYYATDLFPDREITVYPWDADASEWLIKHGRDHDKIGVLTKLLKKVCDHKGMNLDLMPVGDLQTILLVSKRNTAGAEAVCNCSCPKCGHEEEIHVSIPDELEKTSEKPDNYPGYDDITLNDCRDTVRMRPLLVKDEREVVTQAKEPEYKSYSRTSLIVAVRILSIGGGEPDNIAQTLEWFLALSPDDATQLTKFSDEMNPMLGGDLNIACEECGNQYKVNIDFTLTFFRSRGTEAAHRKVDKDVQSGVDGGERVSRRADESA